MFLKCNNSKQLFCRKESTKIGEKNRKGMKENKIKIEGNLPNLFDVTSSRKLIGFVTSGDSFYNLLPREVFFRNNSITS